MLPRILLLYHALESIWYHAHNLQMQMRFHALSGMSFSPCPRRPYCHLHAFQVTQSMLHALNMPLHCITSHSVNAPFNLL